MASGSFSTSVAGGHYILRADWSGTGAASNNTTPVNVKLYLVNDWNLDIGSRSGYIKINGTQTNITSSSISTKGTHLLGQATTNVVHNADGSKSINIEVSWNMNATISGYGYIGTISTSKTVTLDKIPRYATSVQSLKSKTATSITMNWSSDSTIDYVWYSKNGGSSWTAVGSVNAKSGSYTISGLSGGTTYSIKTRVRRKDSQLTTDSSALSVTTYSVPTITISTQSATETSAVIKWTSNKTINKVEYSINNGSSYSTYTSSASATSGTINLTGLTRGTTYYIKVRVTSSEGIQNTSSTLSMTTYQFPYVSKISTSALTIGGSQTVTIYNPLGRSVTVYMKKTSTSGTQLYSGTTSGTSLTFTPNATTLYNSITNAQSATCVYYCVWSSTTVSTVSGTYNVDATASKPTVGSLTYSDQDSAIAQWTGNNQLIVQNQSLCGFTASGISAKNSATISSVVVKILNVNHTMTYSSGSATVSGFRINASSNQKAVVTVTDSRGLTATAEVTVQMLAWSAPTAIIALERENNFYSTTHIKVDAIYSSVNSLNTVTIEYEATADGETTITGTLQDNVEATFTANNEKDWNVRITVTDKFATAVYTRVLSRGTPIIFFDNNLNSVGVNCFPTDAESLEVVSTDGESKHNVAAELELHSKEITGWINDLPVTNIDQFPDHGINGTYWLNLYRTDITGTFPMTGGQGLLICKRQQDNIYRQVYIGINDEFARRVRYYQNGTWTAWTDWKDDIETVPFTPASGIASSLFIRKSGRTVTINGYCSGVTFTGANTSTSLGKIGDFLPQSTIRGLCAIGANAYSVGSLGYVALDTSGSLYVSSSSAQSNRAVYFSLAYTWTART